MSGSPLQLVVAAVVAAALSAQAVKHFHPQAVQGKQGAQVAKAAVPAPKPAPAPAAQRSGYGEYRIAADRLGQYSADVEVNGTRLRMLVDTGASAVALSYEDAAAIGVYPAPADYKYAVSTANGAARVARATLRDVRLGSLVVHDVEALVGERGALSSSLLGMTFLSKLSKIEVASGALVLRQ
jgi:aspartyl protease family protein